MISIVRETQAEKFVYRALNGVYWTKASFADTGAGVGAAATLVAARLTAMLGGAAVARQEDRH